MIIQLIWDLQIKTRNNIEQRKRKVRLWRHLTLYHNYANCHMKAEIKSLFNLFHLFFYHVIDKYPTTFRIGYFR